MKVWQFVQSLLARNSPPHVTLRQYSTLLRTYLGPQWLRVTLMALFLLATIALQLLGPQFIRVFIDAFGHNADQRVLTLTALLYLSTAVGSRLVSALSSYFCENVGWHATNRLREDLTLHCLQLDRSFHSEHTPGELIERVDGNVNALADFFSQFVIRVLGSTLLMIGALILVARENLLFGLLLTLYLLLSLLCFVRVQGMAVPYYKKHQGVEAELSGFWGEVLHSLEEIAANGAASYVMRRYFSLQRRENKTELQGIFFWSCLEDLALTVEVLCLCMLLVLCGYLFVSGALSLGTFILLLTYATQLLDQFFEITEQFNSLQNASASIERINEIYTTTSRVANGPGVHFSSGPLSVSFQNVSFHYEADQPVLRNISFSLAPNETLGLIGRTGRGKTTLTRLLMRFYDPQAGVVSLDGHDIRQAQLDDLRKRIGLVTQEVQLFRGTLRNNLTFFDESISDQRILQAIEQLGIADWYARLPNGLDTELASDCTGLSAGEAQLLSCVRVFLKDPQLLILDEATSRLDPATEKLLAHALESLLAGRTAILIAHRLSTIEHMDRVLVLEAGLIVEYGLRTELLHDPNSRYAQLLQMASPEELLA